MTSEPTYASLREGFRRKLFVPALLFLTVFCTGTLGYYLIGQITGNPDATLRNCIYQTTILLTGVGFADVLNSNQSWLGSIFTVMLAFFGLVTLLYIGSTLIAFIVEGELSHILEHKRMAARIAALRGHFIVCGGGETVRHIATEFAARGRACVVVDENAEFLEELGDETCVLEGDVSHDEVLRKAGIDRAAGLVSVLPQDKDNLLCIITARQLSPALRIVSRCVDRENVKKMARAGADSVVTHNFISGLRLFNETARPATLGFLDTLLWDSDAYRFAEATIPAGHELHGKNLREARLHRVADVHIIAAREANQPRYLYNPHVGLVLAENMQIVFVALPEEVEKLRAYLGN